MFGQLEDSDQSDDPQKGERGTRLGARAAHRRQHVEQRDVIRDDRHHVDDVLEVEQEPQLLRTGQQSDDRLDGEPRRARGLDQKERIQEVRRDALDAMRRGEDRQRFNAEQNNGDERDGDGQEGDDETGARRFGIFEQLPEEAHGGVRRQNDVFGNVAFGTSVLVDGSLHAQPRDEVKLSDAGAWALFVWHFKSLICYRDSSLASANNMILI